MALLCLQLSGLLSSLGAFFFLTFLLLTIYFIFLHFYYSTSQRISFGNLFSSFTRREDPPTNPYQAFRSRSNPTATSAAPGKAGMIVKIILYGFLFLFIFFFLIGLFVSNENSNGNTETVSTVTEEDNGTTYWNEKGNAALANEKQDSALYYYEQALAIDPENVYALYNTGLSHVLRQDYRKGNTFTRRCLRYHPDYDPAWWLLGYSYDLTNQTDSAIYSLEQAYRHDYSQPDFLQLLAEVYVKRNKRSSALEVYQKLVTMDTTRADIFRKMAELDPSNSDRYMQKVRNLEN